MYKINTHIEIILSIVVDNFIALKRKKNVALIREYKQEILDLTTHF